MRARGLIAAIVWMALALIVGATTGSARERGDAAPPRPPGAQGPQEVEVVALVMDPRTQTPTVLLEGKRDRRRFAMAIGVAEATGIALPLHGVTPPRPMTHDLFVTLFGRFQIALTRVVITDLRDDTYYATLHLRSGAGDMTLDSRPSDAIALAIRARVPVLVEDRVFDKAGGPGRPQI